MATTKQNSSQYEQCNIPIYSNSIYLVPRITRLYIEYEWDPPSVVLCLFYSQLETPIKYWKKYLLSDTAGNLYKKNWYKNIFTKYIPL